MSEDDTALLRRLADQDALYRLISDGYCRSVNRLDWEAYRAVFTDRIEIDFSKEWALRRSWETPTTTDDDFPPVREMPAEEWIEFTKQVEGLDVMQNLVTNFLYDLRGDDATVRCYLYCVLYLRGAQGGDRSPIGGEYTFGCRRVDDAWKINRVRFEALWIDGNPDLRAQAIARRAAAIAGSADRPASGRQKAV